MTQAAAVDYRNVAWPARDLPLLPLPTLIVSNVLPPQATGQSIVLQRILRGYDPRCYWLASVTDYNDPARADAGNGTGVNRLPAEYYHLAAEPVSFHTPGTDPWRFPVRRLANQFRRLRARARAIEQIIRRHGIRAVVACSGNLLDLPAACMAASSTGALFFPYMFDDYGSQWVATPQRWLANWLLPKVVRRSKRVVLPNEFLEERYRVKYRARTALVRNPIEPAAIPRTGPVRQPGGPIRIVFTGQVYDAHWDAFQAIAGALELVSSPGAVLDIYTNSPPEDLQSRRLTGRIRVHSAVSPEQSMERQAEADIVFLPLAFCSRFSREVLRTASPGKMGEYLQCGKPVLVLAPPDSYVSWYFQAHRCGLVVNDLETEMLARRVVELGQNRELAAKLVAAAMQRATADFSLDQARNAFKEAIAA